MRDFSRQLGAGWRLSVIAFSIAAAFVPAFSVRAQSFSAATPATVLVVAGHAAVNERPGPPPGELLREIDDPHTGLRWLLFRDPAHPGGPGRLVPVSAGAPQPAGSDNARLLDPPLPPIIRAGDRVIVEQETPVIDARLEGTALGPAQPGSALRVRLRIGGQIVSAVALAPGRAALQPVVEAPK
jgi:hypothetical protein